MPCLVSGVVESVYTFLSNRSHSANGIRHDFFYRFYGGCHGLYLTAIRIAKGGGIPATQHIMQNADKLTKPASYGKYGGYILGGVGLAASCVQIANEDNQQKKNEIFVETIANTTVGLVGGWAVGVFLVSNPVGWGTALVLATGTVAASYGTGKLAQHVYTSSGTKVDLVSGTGVNSICR